MQHFAETPPAPQDPRRAHADDAGARGRFARVALAVVALHAAGLVALDRFDRTRPPQDAGGAVEIPVEVVEDAPAETGAPASPASKPTPNAQPATDAQKIAPPAPQRQQAARSLVLERPRENALPQKAGARGEQGDEKTPDPLHGDKQADDHPFGALAPMQAQADPPSGPTFLSPQALTQPRRRATAETGNDNYRAKVLQKVYEAMSDPGRPRPKAVALVAFTLDDTGALASIELAKRSGHADLDAEALDMVRRAAPYPAPPANADRHFGAFIEFGGE
ncbi:MAG: TonB family protein [Hyphomicrobiales bacterium]|nr:TonB family protein [Hyphomicrobiales bacterium]